MWFVELGHTLQCIQILSYHIIYIICGLIKNYSFGGSTYHIVNTSISDLNSIALFKKAQLNWGSRGVTDKQSDNDSGSDPV